MEITIYDIIILNSERFGYHQTDIHYEKLDKLLVSYYITIF